MVPPGRGTVTLRSVPEDYPPLKTLQTGQVPDPKYAKAVEGVGGQKVAVADFKLARAPRVTLHVVDPSGKPVGNARVDVRELRWPGSEPGKTDANGNYQAVTLTPGLTTVYDITVENPPLGATVEVKGGPLGGATQTLEVKLQPLVSLTGRVLDEEGRPIPGSVVRLLRNVLFPGESKRSIGLPIDSRTAVQADGSYTFDRVIPGAIYGTDVRVEGHATENSRYVTVKSGQPIRLDDFRLSIVDQEVRGIVVDPHGKPLAGVGVNYQHGDRTKAIYAPEGARWFQDTDGAGRFHLTGLPRGPMRLMAYRKPRGGGGLIQNPKSIDLKPGQTDVRIELPD